jgi:hypothetical protein
MSELEMITGDDPICAVIDEAEEIRDPVDGLTERTAAELRAEPRYRRRRGGRGRRSPTSKDPRWPRIDSSPLAQGGNQKMRPMAMFLELSSLQVEVVGQV